MKIGVASRPVPGLNVNGDAYLAKEWDGQTLLAVLDGLGHGEEAWIASTKAKEYLLENYANDLDRLISDLHANLHMTRGVIAELVRIDTVTKRLSFCGIGNAEVRIISEPPMHPASLEGIIGANLRKAKKFEYQYRSIKAVVLHSDGISSKFDISNFPEMYDQPQKACERIMAEYSKEYDDATIIIAIEDDHSHEP